MASIAAGRYRRRIAFAAGLTVALSGSIVLAGWALNITLLRQIAPGIPPTKPNAALMFIVLGIGLAVFSRAGNRVAGRAFATFSGAFCVLLSGITLVEYVWRSLGIDELLFEDTTGSALPGRPSPHAVIGIALAGTNLILLARRERRGKLWAAGINNSLAIVTMVGVFGYAYSVEYLRGFSSVNGIGVLALAALALLLVGLATLDPPGTWLAVFVSPSAGGRMARRFAPLVALTPVMIGLQETLYNQRVGQAIVAVIIVTAMVLTLFAGAIALNRVEAQRKTLGGLLPICSHCKRIRDDSGYWRQVETFVATHSEAEFSHSLCPSCLREHYPDHAEEVIQRLEQQGLAATGVEEARLLDLGGHAKNR